MSTIAHEDCRPGGDFSGHRVLAIHPVLEGIALNPQAGGKDLGASECTDVLLEMGCDVSVWPLSWGGLAASEKIISNHHEIFWGNHGRIKLVPTCATTGPAIRGPRDLVDDVLREHRPRLLHVHQTQNPLVEQVKQKSPQTRSLLSNHSGVVSTHLDQYDHVVVPSHWMRKEITQTRPDLAARVQTIPYFLQEEYTQDPAESPRNGIVFIGLLGDNRKGLDTLLDALAILKSRGQTYPLTVVGEGSRLPQFRQQAESHSLDVTFLRRLSRQQNADLMRRSSLFCMPSRVENFPIVYLESLSCGTPIIGHAPSVTELCQVLETEIGAPFDGQTADAQELASLIEQWMTPKCGAAFDARRDQVRRRVRESYSAQAYRGAYRALYERLLAA